MGKLNPFFGSSLVKCDKVQGAGVSKIEKANVADWLNIAPFTLI